MENAAVVPPPQIPGEPARLVRKHGFLVLSISVALLVPCFWHPDLQAGDFGSHVYNAWLAQLVERGQAPGLWLASQSNNILFDFLLAGLGRFVSLDLAGHIAASLAALLFFWGAFAFISISSRSAPWFLTPILAAFAFGWTFNAGVFNYYMSVGLAFVALSILWSHARWRWPAIVLLIPFIFLSHPLGLAWFIGAGAYITIVERVRLRFHLLLVLGAIAALAAIAFYLTQHYRTVAPAHSVLFYNGLDQLIFTNRYLIPVLLLSAVLIVGFLAELARVHEIQKRQFNFVMLFEIYVIVEAAVYLLPNAIYLPQYAAPLSDLTERLTLISAVLLCALFGTLQPRTWHLFMFIGVAATFFVFLYQDTAALQRLQDRVSFLVRTQPAGQRFILTVEPPVKYRFSAKHILDLACVGYCFDYADYEPPTGQFRVRASPGNQYVMGDFKGAAAIAAGQYVIQPQQIPLYQIFSCGPSWTEMCIRSLRAGETPGLTLLHHN